MRHEVLSVHLGFTVLEIDSSGDTAYLGPAESTLGKLSALLVLDQVDRDKNSYSIIKGGEKQDFTILQYCYLKENTLASFLRHIQNNLRSTILRGYG